MQLSNLEYLFILSITLFSIICFINVSNFFLAFVILELISLCMYVLCSFNKRSVYSIESAIKYFIIGSFASLLILLGIIFLFGFTGFLNFSDLTLFFSYIDLFNGDILIIGILSSFIFIAIGFLFKVYSAPFHF